MKTTYLLSLFCLFVLTSGFKKKPKLENGSITFHFQNVVDTKPLQLNDSTHIYHNANGDDFYVTTFKYYISNIVLTKTNGDTIHMPESYFLVNAADPATLTQKLTGVPTGKYKAVSFIIGVDSLRNFAGAQAGCLDPAKGMFWTWKSGYIFVKMEGVSSKSTSRKNRLTFHIGGATAPDNTIREFSQQLPRKLKIKNKKASLMDVAVNVAAMFKGNTTVRFSDLSFTMGGPKSVIIADNYASGLFKVTNIKNRP